MNDFLQVSTIFDAQHDVHMIRHHAPRMKLVPQSIKMLKCVRNQLPVIAQQTRAASSIQFVVKANSESRIELCPIHRALARPCKMLSFQNEPARDVSR